MADHRKRIGAGFWLLIMSIVSTMALGFWLISHPIRPVIQTKTVEKLVPCPPPLPTKTGPATQRGNGGIAHSGNSDTYTMTPQTPPPKHE